MKLSIDNFILKAETTTRREKLIKSVIDLNLNTLTRPEKDRCTGCYLLTRNLTYPVCHLLDCIENNYILVKENEGSYL